MFLHIKEILTPEQVAQLLEMAKAANWQDGKVSNPHSKTKNNLQLEYGSPAHQQSAKILGEAIQRREEFNDFAFPKRMTPPLITKYLPGMNYGMHTDSSMIMVPPSPLRSDVSTTIFLADPSSYEGGELHVRMGDQSIKIKGEAGSAIIYPSISMHGVEPVTSGERIAAIAFTESYIRDPAKRDILYQVQEVSAEEGFNISWENRNRLDFIRNNLRRMWDGE